MKISENGISMIKGFEGYRDHAYKCLASEKYYTIGYGHYGSDIKAGMYCTIAQASAWLENDLGTAERTVNNKVRVELTQAMYDSLVSLCYNIGETNFSTSTLLKKLNNKEYVGAQQQFEVWRKSGGKVIDGLVKRREKESNYFISQGVPQGLPSLKGYKGFSLVDGLKERGYKYSYNDRKIYAKKLGISGYKGTAKQNTTMLNLLKTL